MQRRNHRIWLGAGAHIAAINATPHAQVTAIFSSRKLDNAEVSARHGCPVKTYTDFDEFLASNIQVVDICSMPAQHRDQAVAAASAGKHLIIEKPLGMSLQECRDIVNAAEANKVLGCVCFECRFSGQFQSTKAILDQGLLGELHYGEVDYYHGIGPGTASSAGTSARKMVAAPCSPPVATHLTPCSWSWAARWKA
ncbi:Gfo/Idh/MocA family protein [Verrucomicrobium spinosum]|uniref:Gfo/Idh/MocA family protein n=1 Tax=Verrucomicrobium spinosum TaxID=2736 RepID=UPI00277D0712|nr:Gfo/Idh/MocA family oxidoreductase [Verrucomicrobium spinosum]